MLGMRGMEIVTLQDNGQRLSALLVERGARVRVNGLPVVGGLWLLEHRDEILIDSKRLHFSTQTAPEMVTYRQGDSRPPVCAICRGPIRDEMPAVRCPGCCRWFHQLESRPCWTYAAECRFCKHPTAFDAQATWKPEEE